MQVNYPEGVFASSGELFICDTNNHRVRKVLRNGQIVTICGTGEAGYNGTQLHSPFAVFVSSSNQVYISENFGHRIRKIDQNGIIHTIAGTGHPEFNGGDQLAIHATQDHPRGLFVSHDDSSIWIADSGNHCIRCIDLHGMISTVAGNGEGGFNGDGQLATLAFLQQPVCSNTGTSCSLPIVKIIALGR